MSQPGDDGPPRTEPPRPLRLALLGSRGIPGRYGGYETLMEELAVRLAARGHQVTVYGRRHNAPEGLDWYKGVRLVSTPTVRHKYLDTPVATALAALHAAGERYDAALLVNSANAIFVPLLRHGGMPVALHVDGIEKRRAKWGWPGRAVYALSERLAGVVADVVVSDAEVIRDHYRERYGVDSVPITYGVDADPDPGDAVLHELGLEPRRYLLYVSRFEPENNPHRVAAAYREVSGDMPLVMVGSAPYASAFIRSFTADADRRIRFPGGIYGVGYRQLMRHALLYIHATEVGGTHPALVEAMGYGNCVVVNDTPENRETAGSAGIYVDMNVASELAGALSGLLADPAEVARRGAAAAAIARQRFDWERVTDRYEQLFRDLASGGGGSLRSQR